MRINFKAIMLVSFILILPVLVAPIWMSLYEHFLPFEAVAQYNLTTSNIQQPQNALNSETTSGTNAAVTKSLTGVSGQRVHLYSVSAYCSAGSGTLTIIDGVAGTTVRSYAAAATHETVYVVPISSTVANGMDVTLGACGAGNTGTLGLHASQF